MLLAKEITSLGKDETIPAKIIIEIPFPIPFAVNFSPIYTKKLVPTINDITTVRPVIKLGFTNTPCFAYVR